MDRPLLRRFPYTCIALALAFTVAVLSAIFDVSRFDLPGVDVLRIDQSEIDAVVMAFLLVLPAIFLDRTVTRQRAHERQLLAGQLRVLRVTMRTVQDIVNNNLNQLQQLRLEADGHVSEETLNLFDATIQDTATQLTALGNLEVYAEKPMESGPGVDLNPSPQRPSG